ncbi:MAG: hypothetical protein HY908_14830 [Myxococcales bacterium]|nr:hypothetical protein [Myxococcales bacterium]
MSRHLGIAAALGCVVGCTAILGNDFAVEGGQGASGLGAGGGTGGTVAQGGGGNSGTGGSGACGDGDLDPGELCDGDCPLECSDADFCTDDHLAGSPQSCNATCPLPVIATCIDNDGCCPGGCYNSIDNDCTLRVLIVSADGNGSPSIQSALQGTGVLGVVDIFPAGSSVPSAGDLSPYDAVLVATNYQGFADPNALGDALADYQDDGGRVVVANGANCTSYALGGRFVTDGNLTIGIGAINPNLEMVGAPAVSTPLLNGVGGYEAPRHCAGQTEPGAVAVAYYQTSGDPALAYRWVGSRRRVDLNLFPETAPTQLLVNALLFQ